MPSAAARFPESVLELVAARLQLAPRTAWYARMEAGDWETIRTFLRHRRAPVQAVVFAPPPPEQPAFTAGARTGGRKTPSRARATAGAASARG